jgi:putative ABC transport system permease protein
MPMTWRKIWRDLARSPARTALVALSIAVGVFVLGVLLGAYAMLVEGLEREWRASIPVHVTLWGQFSEEAERAALRDADVASAERLTDITLRWRPASETGWREARVIARQDYAVQRMGLIGLVAGCWPEGRTLAVESTTARDFGIAPGAAVIVQSGQHERRLEVVGVVHDPDAGLPPSFGGQPDFYATPETVAWLTGVSDNRLDLRIASMPGVLRTPNAAQARVVADRVRDRLDGLGMPASGVWVRNADEHWSRDPLHTLLVILVSSGALSLVLSVFFIVNTMHAIIAQQIWQIGVMKVVGATGVRVMRVYLAVGLIYGALALVLAVPLSYPGARLFSDAVGRALLRSPFEFAYSLEGAGLWLGTVIVISVLASLLPALRATRVSVREALAYE